MIFISILCLIIIISSRISRIMSYAHKNCILSAAKKIMSDTEALRAHLWKSKPCPYAQNCDRSDCGDAHFLEEYRIPMCLYLEFCQKKECKMYHPHMGAPHQYISFMGINRVLLPHQKWEAKKFVIQGAKALMSDKERLRQHFYRTSPCQNGEKCHEKETCQSAHFSDEYRLPICLFFDFCEDRDCKYFHPERDSKEKFIPLFKFSSAEFKEREVMVEKRESIMEPLRPLRQRNPLAVPPKAFKEKTRLCGFVKTRSMCRKGGCTFAHSLEELIVSDSFSSLQEKKEYVESTTGKIVEDYYLRPSYKNSVERKRENDELKFVMMMRAEENGEKYEETEEPEETQYDEDDENIEEVLQEIQMDEHKEQFLCEMDDFEEFEEFDDEVVVDTFYYDQNGKMC